MNKPLFGGKHCSIGCSFIGGEECEWCYAYGADVELGPRINHRYRPQLGYLRYPECIEEFGGDDD